MSALRRVQPGKLWMPILATVLAVGAVAIAIVGYVSLDADDQSRAVRDFPKLAFQFLLLGVLGVYVNFLVQRYRDRLAQTEAASEFRKETAQRLVDVTHRVRKAQLLLAIDRSPKTYDEQVRELIDVTMDLRAIGHESETRGTFTNRELIREAVGAMTCYLESLVYELRVSRRRVVRAWWPTRDVRDTPHLDELLAGVPPDPKESLFDQDYLAHHQEALREMRDEIVELG